MIGRSEAELNFSFNFSSLYLASILYTCLKFTSVNVRREPKKRRWKSTLKSVDTRDLIAQGVNIKNYGAWKPKATVIIINRVLKVWCFVLL